MFGCSSRSGVSVGEWDDHFKSSVVYGPSLSSESIILENGKEYYEMFPGYRIELPKQDVLIMRVSSRGAPVPLVLLDFNTGEVTTHNRSGEFTGPQTVSLNDTDALMMKGLITTDFLSKIPLRNERFTRGGKVVHVFARLDDGIFEIYHELPDQEEMLTLIAQYYRLLHLVNIQTAN